MKDKIEYTVELRNHYENGYGEDDYTEDHYDFDTKSEAMKFAQKNYGSLHSVGVYTPDGKGRMNYEDITP